MTTSKENERAVPVINEPPPQRPKTLLQRLSSGIVHVLPSLRVSSSRNNLIDRPTAASGPSEDRVRNWTNVAESEQLLVPDTEITASNASTQPCPYDPNSYLSFTSIEKRRCSLCGMRGPKIVYNEPCYACKTGSQGSHIASDRRYPSTHQRDSAVDRRPFPNFADSSDSDLLGPRPVTPERAARRIGNPPRVSKLPPGIVRLPASAVDNTHPLDLAARPPSRLSMRFHDSERQAVHARSFRSHRSETSHMKPVIPKLHHLHGLSNSEDFPFIHRHEIPQHAIALHAGSSSPLTDRSNSPKSSSHARGSPDFSNTVYYGRQASSRLPDRNTIQKPQVTTVVVKQLHASGRATIDLHASPLDEALAESKVYRKHSPKQTSAKLPQVLNDVIDSSTTFGSQDTGSTKIGGMRLELKGGSLSTTGMARLRGGSGHERVSTNTLSFRIKRWILLCHGPCPEFDGDSDDDLPPPRLVTPDRVTKTRQKMNGTAPLPDHLCRRPSSIASIPSIGQIRPATDSFPLATTFTTTISGPPKRNPSSRCSSLFRRCSERSICQPILVAPRRVLTPPHPHLRGGAESPDNIPPTISWLAGGFGRKPIRFSGWKQSRPKQRMGGLLGMAIFGDRYGKEYEVEAKVAGDVEVECSASIKVTAGDTVSIGGVQDGADFSSSSSSSSGVCPEPLQHVADSLEEDTHAEPVQRALTPPLAEPDGVPLCSGALPVGSVEPALGGDATPSLSEEGCDKEDRAIGYSKAGTGL